MSINYLSQNSLDALKRTLQANIKHYEEDADFSKVFKEQLGSFMESQISYSGGLSETIITPDNKNDLKDGENSKIVYEALRYLTLQQATDERIWAYMTHVELPDYVRARWPIDKAKVDSGKYTYIVSHYFVRGNRGLVRDNAISRLWWMGYIANRCTDKSLRLEKSFRDSPVQSGRKSQYFGTTKSWIK